MKDYRKIDYYRWNMVRGFYEYKASTVARKNLIDAAMHLPELEKDGSLIYRPRCQVKENPATTPKLWKIVYSDSNRCFDAYEVLQRGKKHGTTT